MDYLVKSLEDLLVLPAMQKSLETLKDEFLKVTAPQEQSRAGQQACFKA